MAGSKSQRLQIVLSGQVSVFYPSVDGDFVLLNQYGPGTQFGDSYQNYAASKSSHVVATVASKLLSLLDIDELKLLDD